MLLRLSHPYHSTNEIETAYSDNKEDSALYSEQLYVHLNRIKTVNTSLKVLVSAFLVLDYRFTMERASLRRLLIVT